MLKNNQAYLVAPQQGFTLLEVMISTVILTVSLLGVAGMYGFGAFPFTCWSMNYN